MSGITEAKVRELCGVAPMASQGAETVLLFERKSWVGLKSSTYQEVFLDPSEARRLAQHLYRLANRIEKRAQASEAAPAGKSEPS